MTARDGSRRGFAKGFTFVSRSKFFLSRRHKINCFISLGVRNVPSGSPDPLTQRESRVCRKAHLVQKKPLLSVDKRDFFVKF